jgi:glycerophosphoryl diester phosphodiesterase
MDPETSWKRIGHRGAPAMAAANTIPSFVAALATGCDWVECDCRAARDSVVVLAHDDTVTDAGGRRHRIAERTASELSALDLGDGAGVPTLEDLVIWAMGRVGVMADIKEGGLEQPIGALLSLLGPEHVIIPGADDAGRARFRALFPDLPLSLSLGRESGRELDRRLPALDTEAVTLEHPLVTPERVALCRARGIAVYAWTVDDLASMGRLLHLGVDGIISNRADLLAEAAGLLPAGGAR